MPEPRTERGLNPSSKCSTVSVTKRLGTAKMKQQLPPPRLHLPLPPPPTITTTAATTTTIPSTAATTATATDSRAVAPGHAPTSVPTTVPTTVTHLLGLVSYDSEVVVHTMPTADYDVFEDVIDDMRTKGMTAIYAAIARACKMLAPVGQAHPAADLRVICLTDGQNNCNDVDAAAAVAELAKIGAVCDCLLVGDRTDTDLRKLVTATHGECFTLEGLADAYEVFESKAFVSLAERRGGAPKPSLKTFQSRIPKSLGAVKLQAPKKGAFHIPAAAAGGGVGGTSSYAGKTRFAPLSDLVADSSIGKLDSSASNRRLRKELLAIAAQQQQQVFYFPGIRDDNTVKEIKVFIAPEADATLATASPYSGAVFEALLSIPDSYPFAPPSLKLVTPIYHYAVSTAGEICLELLKRDWSPAKTISKLLGLVHDLIANPKKVDPTSDLAVRSWLSEQLRVSPADYYAEAKKQAELHAKPTPKLAAGQALSAGMLEAFL